MTDHKLKPCPFCGDEAATQSFYKNHCVYCSGCGASTLRYYPTKEDAIEAWNRRVNDEA